MSQCLRCSKPCEASAVFCDECRSLLRNEFRQGSVSHSPDPGGTVSSVGTRSTASSLSSASAPSSVSTSIPSLVAQKPDESQDDLAYHNTKPLGIAETPRSPDAPVTPHPPTLTDYPYPDIAEQTMSRLSEAAQFISEVEPASRRLPRASRLAPMRDISADIRRESTPLPKLSKMRYSTGAPERVNASGPLPAAHREVDNNGELPDLWPWLDSEVEERENEDTWANSTDPLIARRIPNSVESARIEEEDIKRALAEGMPTAHNLRLVRPRRAFSLRIAFAILAILAALALIVDGILFSVVVAHPKHANTVPNGPAVSALRLFPNEVTVTKKTGPQQVKVHIMNFLAGHSVQLSHDVQEPVKTVGSSSMFTIGKDGLAEVTIIVDDSWSVGFDQVYAEDITTHFIASAQLQVVGNASSLPAHLELLGQNGKPIKSLDFGSVIQGSNTILHLTLENSGSGSITWSASSNQPWLLVSPGQGTFSQSQKIDVAAQSVNLNRGEHKGTLTLSSNVSAQPQTIQVTMTVLHATIPGPVLAPTPAVLSFTTTDGSKAPLALTLTLNNPGTQTLNWSLVITASVSSSNQLAFAHVSGITSSNWLSATPDQGTIPAGSYKQLQVSVNSNSLLPGAYQGYLVFSALGAVDGSSQTVAVSLTVQPHCGLVTNSGYLSFTAVQGTNPSNQSLGLNATASCAGAPISWKAALSSSYNWLNATPTSGTLNSPTSGTPKGTTSEFISVGANATGLPPKSYYGFMALTTQNSTQTVMVALTVQPPPAPGAPVMSAAPLNLNFSNTYGQPNPKGQVVTITNTGQSPLYWSTNDTIIGPSWLSTSPTGSGTMPVQPGQTEQLVVNINTSQLSSPGTYAGQIGLTGRDSSGKPASGSGQVVSINLVVQPACTLTQPSSSSLAFSSAQGGSNPISQTLLITGTGNCAWPLTLSFSASSAPWLRAEFPTGSSIKASGQSVAFVVSADLQNLTSGPPRSASFTISAIDSAGTIATGSPQPVTATLTVLPPCLPVVASTLAFTAAQGQASPVPQNVSLSEINTCSYPINWMVTTSTAWLGLSTPTADTGSGSSFKVSVNNAALPAGPYMGTITVSATDSSGYVVGAPQTITVTLTVTPTYSVSGTVMACTGVPNVCLTPAALPGATLTLFDSSNRQVASIIADVSGNYTFNNLSPGNYTINISGTLNSVNYSATGIPLVVTTSATALTLNTW
jgi:hypothetical protein